MSNFKVIFIGIFIAAAIFGMLVFAGVIKIGGGSASQTQVQGSVTVWGTFDRAAMQPFVENFNTRNNSAKISMGYEQKDAATFDQTLIEAIASGTAPDLVLLPDSLAWRYQDKLTHIPFASLPAQTYADTFVQAAQVFSVSDGFLAVPFAADPLIMYYNRDLLAAAGIAQAPALWQPFIESVPKLAKKTSDLTLTETAAALGTFANIAHAKDILALLFFENGNAFITGETGRPTPHFGPTATGTEGSGAVSAVDFYMAFADPLKEVYTWNAGEPLDRSSFIASKLAYYFGSASELPGIRAQNPNLNFGIALPPQAPRGLPVTSGRVYGFAIPKAAPNQTLSFTAATMLASAESGAALVEKAGTTLALVPARRDILANRPAGDLYLGLLYNAALVQRSWLDPNPAGSTAALATLIRDISSSNLDTGAALAKAAAQLLFVGGRI